MDINRGDRLKDPVVARSVIINKADPIIGTVTLFEYDNGIIVRGERPNEAGQPPGLIESWLVIQESLAEGEIIAKTMTPVEFEKQYKKYLYNHVFVPDTNPLLTVFEQKSRKEILENFNPAHIH